MRDKPSFTIRPAPDLKARAERKLIRARARFRETGSNPFEVELFDLSASGFRMTSYARPPVGTHIWVSLPGLQSLEAVVRRAKGNDFGCQFVNALHPAVAKHLQAQLGPA